MKKYFYLILLLSGFVNAQIVTIPDANFKAKLLEASPTNQIAAISGVGYANIDTNFDGEIQLSEAALVVSLSFDAFPGSNIQDFTGINSFVNLVTFNSSFNNAKISIDGLTNLQTFNFTNNYTSSFSASVFNNLPSLTHFYYQQTSVNSIIINNCPNITKLWAQQNSNLTTLTINSIPALKQFWAWGCSILNITIPNSPILEELDLHSNFTISSVVINNSPLLKKLDLSANNITDISGFSANLNNIEQLQLRGNIIPNITLPTSMPNLQSLSFNGTSNNNLNFANYPSLSSIVINPGTMTNLDVTNVPLLYQLVVSENPITFLDLSNNVLIWNLAIFNCPISTLDFSNLSQLSNVSCSGLLVTELDFSNNPLVSSLRFHDNQNLLNVNLKSGTVNAMTYNVSDFYNVPNLQYICVDEGDTINYSIVGFTPTIPITSYCNFTPGGDYNTITGAMIFDANTNGCDALDFPQPNIKININDGTAQGSTFTNNSGNYNFYTETGSFVVTPSVENASYFTFSPTSATVPFANDNNNIVTQNFCITANGVHPDLEIVIAPIVPARPGFDAVYQIVYKNKGNQTLSQLYGVNFFFNQNLMDFVSATTTPSTVGPGSLSWSYTNLLPFESRSIYVTLNINTPTDTTNPVNIGDILQFTTSILPMAGDESTVDNTFLFNQTVVGSFDPNNIICMEGNVVSPSEIGNYLHYVINFENTGTSEAENIVVQTDVNLNDFDINSLQMLATSHNAYIKVVNNQIEFIFQNIMLETGGHGNVLLKIRSKSNLVNGDIVSKKADIFFDYNFPIDTGMANTTFQALSTGEFVTDNSITVFPNPAMNFVTINSDSTINSIQLYDVQGRLLQTKIENKAEITFDISNQSSGIYFFKIQSDNGVKVVKLIKE
jgi:Leucine-rich repeat (LRR) protein